MASRAQESITAAIQHLTEHCQEVIQQKENSDWSDWSLLDMEEFQDLKQRVEALEAGIPSEPVDGVAHPSGEHAAQLYADLIERVSDLEAQGPRRARGAGVGLPERDGAKSIVDSKVVASLSPLTDDKSAFRQWDAKMVNAVSHLKPGYGRIIRVPALVYDLLHLL